MVLVKKQQIHRMNISFLKAEKKLVYLELKGPWVTMMPERWGEGTELDPESNQRQED